MRDSGSGRELPRWSPTDQNQGFRVDEGPPLSNRSIHALVVGDEVAILAAGAELERQVLEISTVRHVRAFTLELENGKLYSRTDGHGLVTSDYIEPAHETYRQALAQRNKTQ